MTDSDLHRYTAVWTVDSEYFCPDGSVPFVHCICARELWTRREIRVWHPHEHVCPIRCGPDVLFAAYGSTAELRTWMTLGWELPLNILDLFTEQHWLFNGCS
ncbi:MAG: hypothetical protein ACYDH9_26625 [Limisphaerales bacterium]